MSKWTKVTPFSLKYAPNSFANADGFNVGSFTFLGSVIFGFSAPFFLSSFLAFPFWSNGGKRGFLLNINLPYWILSCIKWLLKTLFGSVKFWFTNVS